MADLVIYGGAQWRLDRLPAHIDPADCVPLDEWMRANRVAGARRPVEVAPPAVAPDVAKASPAAPQRPKRRG
jgi:hypothetical protein